MLIGRVFNVFIPRYRHLFTYTKCNHLVFRLQWRLSSSIADGKVGDISRTRNIGIIAHIDAGKTTTTERMLYYSGYTRRLGEVDEGSTVTDFLPAERARGITIQSAAITFTWPPLDASGPLDASSANRLPSSSDDSTSMALSSVPHSINLIDTPGHADFTFEVLRSLRILDGAVCILDSVSGVEAQTEAVWAQAKHYQIPTIVYVNKLDREGASFARTVRDIFTHLQAMPALCHIPWWSRAKDRKFCGVGDVVNLRAMLWVTGSQGHIIKTFGYQELFSIDPEFAAELKEARIALVDLLGDDEQIVESFLAHDENHLEVSSIEILASLRRCTLQSPQSIVPVLAGSSLRNIGVQPLLDAVIDLLPSPRERPDPEVSLGNIKTTLDQFGVKPSIPSTLAEGKLDKLMSKLECCALAFKVVNDAKRGILIYIRVYSGSLRQGTRLYNTNLAVMERVPRLFRMYASDAVEIDSIDSGQIGVIVGLKHARTGDTLISFADTKSRSSPPDPIDKLQLRPIAAPPPLFFTSVEPNSLSEEKHVENVLQILLREDPSLSLINDSETGQRQLAGMGELHLEIARDRLIRDLKAKATIGNIEISYREAVTAPSDVCSAEVDRQVAGHRARAGCTATVEPNTGTYDCESGSSTRSVALPLLENNLLIIRHPTLTKSGKPIDDGPCLPANLPLPVIFAALQAGTAAALARGSAHALPLHSTKVTIDFDPRSHIFPETSPAAIAIVTRNAIQDAVRSAYRNGTPAIMEPVMLATITVGEEFLGQVTQDLTSARGAQILSLGDDDAAVSPLANPLVTSPALTQMSKNIYTPPDPFSIKEAPVNLKFGLHRTRNIIARVPLREMVGYLKRLKSLNGGRGTFIMQVDRFDRVSGTALKRVLNQVQGL